MHTVEVYDPTPHDYPGALRAPVLAVVEDDEGFRWLLTADGAAAPLHLQRAIAAGAQAVLAPGAGIARLGTGWYAASISDYLAATQVTADPMLAVGTAFAGIPNLLDLKAAEHAGPVAPTGSQFVNLHTHSEYSPLDGLSRLGPLAARAASFGQHSLAVTDHGYCTGHPALQAAADAVGVRPVFGLEAYFTDDIGDRGDQYDYWHLILLARDDAGLRNLWGLSTASWRDGFYGKPRVDWQMLKQYSGGLVATTACLGGPLSKALLAGDRQTASARLARLQEVFGQDVYAEIQSYPHPDQVKVNTALVELAADHGVPLVAAADSHYTDPADHDRHQVWLSCAMNKGVGETGMFSERCFHLHTEAEMRAALSYLPAEAVQQAVANTSVIADSCDARIRTSKSVPLSGPGATHDSDAKDLRELAVAGWAKLPPGEHGDQREYIARFEREMDLLEAQHFCGYYLIVADYCRWAKDHHILVGPGRGSGGASLVAYLVGITEIDPVRWDLPFERFLTPGRVSMPDFDVDFPASKRAEIHAYLRSRWGEDHVVSIGNIQRMGNKATIRNLMRALRPTLPPTSFADTDKISKIIDDAEAGTAGLGLSWEELWAQHGERLQPYRDLYPQVFAEADALNGTVITYGKHAAGVIISTGEPLTGQLPLRGGEDHTQMVSQFDDDGVEALGHVKFDILTLRTLDTIQKALDSIAGRYGFRPDLYGFSQELDDPEVWEMISSGAVLGCFQIETTLGAQMCKAMHPSTLNELADVVTLVRPGPRNAGLTREYLRRRNGEARVSVPDDRLADVLRPTWGVIIYQEQVLAVCRIIAGYSDAEADDVRKILGKKLVDKIDAAGRDFIARAVQRGMDRAAATVLWEQMAEFSKYAFGKAHAYAYALLTWWTAFLKVHYPVEFIAAALSTVDKERIPEFVKEAHRMGVDVLPPDINTSKTGFTVGESATVRYGLDSLKGIGTKAAADIIANAPYTSVADLRQRTGSSVNSGTVRLLARAGAFDCLPGEPHRAALVAVLDAEASGAAKRCVDRLPDAQAAEGELPCRFDWAAEPPTVNERTGKKLAAKPPPKRCTAACRRYRPTGTAEVALVERYTPEQIGQTELELLGLYLTWTPFHRVHPAARENLRSEAEALASGQASGTVTVLAVAEQLKPYTAKNGLQMGFVKLATEGPDLDTACMSTLWDKIDPDRLTGALVLADVRRTDRGLTLVGIEPF